MENVFTLAIYVLCDEHHNWQYEVELLNLNMQRVHFKQNYGCHLTFQIYLKTKLFANFSSLEEQKIFIK